MLSDTIKIYLERYPEGNKHEGELKGGVRVNIPKSMCEAAERITGTPINQGDLFLIELEDFQGLPMFTLAPVILPKLTKNVKRVRKVFHSQLAKNSKEIQDYEPETAKNG
jgi:hypothetical protein